MTPKDQLKAETKRITNAIKERLKKNEGLISKITPADFGIKSDLLFENSINTIFYAQKEIYFNSEFGKFKTQIKQSIVKIGLAQIRYIEEYLNKNPNAKLPNDKFTLYENIVAYKSAIQEYLDDKI